MSYINKPLEDYLERISETMHLNKYLHNESRDGLVPGRRSKIQIVVDAATKAIHTQHLLNGNTYSRAWGKDGTELIHRRVGRN